jgi:hydroxypyruvate reductase
MEILGAALAAADPIGAVSGSIGLEGDALRVGNEVLELGGSGRIVVVGGGKAGSSMSQALEGVLGERISAGLVNVKYGYGPSERLSRIRIREAGHPVPDREGVEATREMLELVEGLSPQDVVICLISGGGSALMTFPNSGIALEDIQTLTQSLLASGATINEINAVRKHLSQVKGGNLARRANPARVVSLILSDVVGDPLDVIASGPTVPDSATFSEALGVLEKYDLVERSPEPVVRRLREGNEGVHPDTPKEGDPIFQSVHNEIVGSNRLASRAAGARANDLGFNAMVVSTFVEGEAREVGKVAAALAKETAVYDTPLQRPACYVMGGETTVTLRGKGKGGRNQELALAASLALEGWQDVMIVAAATDGTDGPTDATGAIASGSTAVRARRSGLEPWKYLANNDAYYFFERLGELLLSGPTNTNVNDLILILTW